MDDQTGEVLAGNVSDGQDGGRFRIELPAERQVRLIAHPLHADAALFGQHFVPSQLLTPGGFEPTEFMNGDQPAVFTVPDGSTQAIDPVMVDPPADPPLLNKDAPVIALLPGGRAHVVAHYDGLGTDSPTVTASLSGLTLTNVTQTGDQVEFDVAAAADTTGASTLEVKSGAAANLQVGSLWVRPLTGLVLANDVEPKTVASGTSTEVLVSGYGLDQVTRVRVVNEMSSAELAAQVEGTDPNGKIRVKVDAPADAPAGPWDVRLETAQGEAPPAPEPQSRLWVGRARIQTDSVLDLGDVPLGQSTPVSVRVTNLSSDPYTLSSYQWSVFQGGVSIDGNLTVSPVAPGASGMLTLNVMPTQLGPGLLVFNWLEGGVLDAVTEVRFWGIPATGGN